MATPMRYQVLGTGRRYQWLAAFLAAGVVAALGGASGLYLIMAGHHVTGMGTQVAWGLPHVLAIILILAGAGAFGVTALAPRLAGSIEGSWARLGVVTAVALLMGGLAVLGLDLGSPQHIMPPKGLNFLSSFSRNIALYTAFVAVALLYLGTLMEPQLRRWQGLARGLAALVALLLALNVGSIFGLLAAKPGYGGAIMMPLFLAAAVTYGIAALSLVWLAVIRSQQQAPPAPDSQLLGLALLGGLLATAVLLALHFLTLGYLPGQQEVARFLLIDGGAYPALFWLGVVAIGIITPALLLLRRAGRADARALALASGLTLLGGLAHLFVMIVGVQSYPIDIFPGQKVTGAVLDEEAFSYIPSLWEVALGLGGIGVTLAILLLGVRVLPLTPREEY